MAATDLHSLTAALGLVLPTDATVRAVPQGLAAEHPTQGWRLTAFQRPATAGANPPQLHAAVVGSLAKRYPEAAVEAPAAPVSGPGWQGLRSALGVAGGRTLRVLTVVEAEAAVLVGVVLEVTSTAPPSLQPEAWLRATPTAAGPAPAKLALSLAPIDGETPAAAPAKPALSLAPIEGKAPAAAPAKPALSLAPIEGETPAAAPAKPALSLAPIDGEAAPATRANFTLALVEDAPAAAAPAEAVAARARFGAREPSTGPVAASLQPVAAHAPPPMPSANPYQPPDTVALEAETEADPEALRAAGRGQRILIWCVLLNFAVRGIHRNPEVPVFMSWAISVALMAWAFHGVLLIASGFGYGRGTKLGLMFGSTVPLLGIGLWIWLSMKTTRALKAAGHTVGFFGVKS